MRARTILVVALVSVVVMGCGRYSFGIRRQYDRGQYGATVARCENVAAAAGQQWNDGHRARYHVYCGMAYLNLGDTQRAASELVLAERMRLANPGLIRGRDLASLSQGLTRLFGVPAGQLEIEERPSAGAVAVGQRPDAPPAPPVTVVPPAPSVPPVPVAPRGPAISFSAGAGVSAHATVQVSPAEPEPPAAPEPPPATVIVAPPPAPPAPPAAPAAPPVIVIPDEDGAVIE